MLGDDAVNVSDNGTVYEVVGTSIATPLWAAFNALMNQQAAAKGLSAVGFLNPALYTLAKGTNYLNAFHDITSGNNLTRTSQSQGQYYAVAGYDLCTGWGTPAGSNTINLLLQVGNNLIDHFSWSSVASPVTANNSFAATLTALSASNTTITGFAGTATVSVAQIQTNALFSRDFETGTLSDWVNQGGGLHLRYHHRHRRRRYDFPACLSQAGTDRAVIMGFPTRSPTWPRTVSNSNVKATDNTKTGGYVVAGSDKYRTNAVFHFRMGGSSGMGLTDAAGNSTPPPSPPTNGIRSILRLHWTTKTVGYYVDDTLVMDNIPFCNSTLTSLAVMNLYNFDNTQVWYDRLA